MVGLEREQGSLAFRKGDRSVTKQSLKVVEGMLCCSCRLSGGLSEGFFHGGWLLGSLGFS